VSPWRPESFSDIAQRLQTDPKGAGNALDITVQTISSQIDSVSQSVTSLQPSGNITRNRPVNPALYSIFFDTTLNKPIWFVGQGKWRDATGALV
jgi:hypothetical protein